MSDFNAVEAFDENFGNNIDVEALEFENIDVEAFEKDCQAMVREARASLKTFERESRARLKALVKTLAMEDAKVERIIQRAKRRYLIRLLKSEIRFEGR